MLSGRRTSSTPIWSYSFKEFLLGGDTPAHVSAITATSHPTIWHMVPKMENRHPQINGSELLVSMMTQNHNKTPFFG